MKNGWGGVGGESPRPADRRKVPGRANPCSNSGKIAANRLGGSIGGGFAIPAPRTIPGIGQVGMVFSSNRRFAVEWASRPWRPALRIGPSSCAALATPVMENTRHSLLQSAQQGSEEAWAELHDLYRPLLYGWVRRQGGDHAAAEEISQEVLAVVAGELPQFEHSGRTGAFRAWLRTITVFRAKAFWKSQRHKARSPGGSEFFNAVTQLADPNSDLTQEWNRQHDMHLLRQLLVQLDHQFEPATVQAFRRVVLLEQPAREVARDMGLSLSAVYTAKSRVLKTLREQARGLLDDSSIC